MLHRLCSPAVEAARSLEPCIKARYRPWRGKNWHRNPVLPGKYYTNSGWASEDPESVPGNHTPRGCLCADGRNTSHARASTPPYTEGGTPTTRENGKRNLTLISYHRPPVQKRLLEVDKNRTGRSMDRSAVIGVCCMVPDGPSWGRREASGAGTDDPDVCSRRTLVGPNASLDHNQHLSTIFITDTYLPVYFNR